MDERRQQLLATIEVAFRSVELGDGVSLHETIAVDNRLNEQSCQAARAPDEKHDWRRLIGNPELARIGDGVGGLNFYDAAGLRFHLPAYLSLAVIDFDRADAAVVFDSLVYTLTHKRDQRLAILNQAQRRCVWEVLQFLHEQSGYAEPEVAEAIWGYWNPEPESGS